MSKHTPGKWTVERDEEDRLNIVAKDGAWKYFVAEAISGLPEDEQNANASLIAAAPEMLRELNHLASIVGAFLESGGSIPGLATVNAARAIIAKIEGVK